MAGAPFLVAAMYTDGYAGLAERLRRSCERFSLEHELRRVPAVHQSISKSGSPDLRYTKPRFILDVLERRRGPVLYVDADCEFRQAPALIGELIAAGTDFATSSAEAVASHLSARCSALTKDCRTARCSAMNFGEVSVPLPAMGPP